MGKFADRIAKEKQINDKSASKSTQASSNKTSAAKKVVNENKKNVVKSSEKKVDVQEQSLNNPVVEINEIPLDSTPDTSSVKIIDEIAEYGVENKNEVSNGAIKNNMGNLNLDLSFLYKEPEKPKSQMKSYYMKGEVLELIKKECDYIEKTTGRTDVQSKLINDILLHVLTEIQKQRNSK